MCVVPMKVQYGNSGKVLETHALLDSCSQDTFILERLINNLGMKGQKTSITIKTLNGEVNGSEVNKQGNGSEGTESNKWQW